MGYNLIYALIQFSNHGKNKMKKRLHWVLLTHWEPDITFYIFIILLLIFNEFNIKVKLHFSGGERQTLSNCITTLVLLGKRMKTTQHASNIMYAKQGHDIVTSGMKNSFVTITF